MKELKKKLNFINAIDNYRAEFRTFRNKIMEMRAFISDMKVDADADEDFTAADRLEISTINNGINNQKITDFIDFVDANL